MCSSVRVPSKKHARRVMIGRMTSPAGTAPAPQLRDRTAIAEQFKWNLADIFPDWTVWQAAFDDLDRKIAAYAALQGTLAQGAEQLLAAMRLSDDIGQLTYKVWYFASLKYRSEETRLNSSHSSISYAVFCLKKKNKKY